MNLTIKLLNDIFLAIIINWLKSLTQWQKMSANEYYAVHNNIT